MNKIMTLTWLGVLITIILLACSCVPAVEVRYNVVPLNDIEQEKLEKQVEIPTNILKMHEALNDAHRI